MAQPEAFLLGASCLIHRRALSTVPRPTPTQAAAITVELSSNRPQAACHYLQSEGRRGARFRTAFEAGDGFIGKSLFMEPLSLAETHRVIAGWYSKLKELPRPKSIIIRSQQLPHENRVQYVYSSGREGLLRGAE